jgi:pectin methylesterase-like acyl-CoA thioesterase
MRVWAGLWVCLAAGGLLTACSSMPSWTKPSVWYDQVTGDPQAVEKAAAEDAAKAAKPKEPEPDFPNLAKTPAVPAAGLTAAQQREVRESLAADRAATQEAVDAVKKFETPETRANAAAKPPPRGQ